MQQSPGGTFAVQIGVEIEHVELNQLTGFLDNVFRKTQSLQNSTGNFCPFDFVKLKSGLLARDLSFNARFSNIVQKTGQADFQLIGEAKFQGKN